jgi:hypothetical protein
MTHLRRAISLCLISSSILRPGLVVLANGSHNQGRPGPCSFPGAGSSRRLFGHGSIPSSPLLWDRTVMLSREAPDSQNLAFVLPRLANISIVHLSPRPHLPLCPDPSYLVAPCCNSTMPTVSTQNRLPEHSSVTMWVLVTFAGILSLPPEAWRRLIRIWSLSQCPSYSARERLSVVHIVAGLRRRRHHQRRVVLSIHPLHVPARSRRFLYPFRA